MQIKQQVCTVWHKNSACAQYTSCLQTINLFEETWEMDHYSIANHTYSLCIQYPRWHQVKCKLHTFIIIDCVASVCTSLTKQGFQCQNKEKGFLRPCSQVHIPWYSDMYLPSPHLRTNAEKPQRYELGQLQLRTGGGEYRLKEKPGSEQRCHSVMLGCQRACLFLHHPTASLAPHKPDSTPWTDLPRRCSRPCPLSSPSPPPAASPAPDSSPGRSASHFPQPKL